MCSAHQYSYPIMWKLGHNDQITMGDLRRQFGVEAEKLFLLLCVFVATLLAPSVGGNGNHGGYYGDDGSILHNIPSNHEIVLKNATVIRPHFTGKYKKSNPTPIEGGHKNK